MVSRLYVVVFGISATMIKSTMIQSSQAKKLIEKNGLKKKCVRFANDVCVDETESLRSAFSSKLDECDENIEREAEYRNEFSSSEDTMNNFYDDATTKTASSRAHATISSYVSSFSSLRIQFFPPQSVSMITVVHFVYHPLCLMQYIFFFLLTARNNSRPY